MTIKLKGVSVSKKPRRDGRYQGYYCDGKDKQYVYAYTREECERKVQKLVKTGIHKKQRTVNGAPTGFTAFTMFIFEKFRKRKVIETTYKTDLSRFNSYLKPKFKDRPLKSIKPQECQDLLDRITDSGKGKTADEIYTILNIVFKTAIKFGILTRNPLDIIFHRQHVRKNGTALSYAEIRRLIDEGGDCKQIYMIALYTGLRPNEYATIRIDNDFIIATNSKRKNGKVETKKIPIMRELKPYLTDKLNIPYYEYIRKHFKGLFPHHTLKDLRRTFNSRCIECGVSDVARKLWMGHSIGELGRAYIELSDEFMRKEAEKFYFFTQN